MKYRKVSIITKNSHHIGTMIIQKTYRVTEKGHIYFIPFLGFEKVVEEKDEELIDINII